MKIRLVCCLRADLYFSKVKLELEIHTLHFIPTVTVKNTFMAVIVFQCVHTGGFKAQNARHIFYTCVGMQSFAGNFPGDKRFSL